MLAAVPAAEIAGCQLPKDGYQCGTGLTGLVVTGHDDTDEAHTALHYPGRSPWV